MRMQKENEVIDMEDIILLGIGGHAHSVVDSIEQAGQYRIVGFLDVKEHQNKEYRGYQVVGTDDMLESYYRKGVKNAFITVGYLGEGSIREKLYKELKRIGYTIPNIIDETAIVASDVRLGEGNYMGKRTVINANAEIGTMCIINTGAIVEHDCCIGDMTHIAVGAVLCGRVTIGDRTLIGAGAVVRQGIHIGSHVIIGAGMTITKDINNNIKKYGHVEEYIEG